MRLETLLKDPGEGLVNPLTLFALINLGVIESLANGSISAMGAVRLLYNAENCLYVRRSLKDKKADDVMGRGVQLPDLFDCLPVEEAQREFAHELAVMRSLCIKLIERKGVAA